MHRIMSMLRIMLLLRNIRILRQIKFNTEILAPCRKLCRYSTKWGDWRENICPRWRRRQFRNSMTWCRKWLRRGDLGSKIGHGNQNRVGHLKLQNWKIFSNSLNLPERDCVRLIGGTNQARGGGVPFFWMWDQIFLIKTCCFLFLSAQSL